MANAIFFMLLAILQCCDASTTDLAMQMKAMQMKSKQKKEERRKTVRVIFDRDTSTYHDQSYEFHCDSADLEKIVEDIKKAEEDFDRNLLTEAGDTLGHKLKNHRHFMLRCLEKGLESEVVEVVHKQLEMHLNVLLRLVALSRENHPDLDQIMHYFDIADKLNLAEYEMWPDQDVDTASITAEDESKLRMMVKDTMIQMDLKAMKNQKRKYEETHKVIKLQMKDSLNSTYLYGGNKAKDEYKLIIKKLEKKFEEDIDEKIKSLTAQIENFDYSKSKCPAFHDNESQNELSVDPILNYSNVCKRLVDFEIWAQSQNPAQELIRRRRANLYFVILKNTNYGFTDIDVQSSEPIFDQLDLLFEKEFLFRDRGYLPHSSTQHFLKARNYSPKTIVQGLLSEFVPFARIRKIIAAKVIAQDPRLQQELDFEAGKFLEKEKIPPTEALECIWNDEEKFVRTREALSAKTLRMVEIALFFPYVEWITKRNFENDYTWDDVRNRMYTLENELPKRLDFIKQVLDNRNCPLVMQPGCNNINPPLFERIKKQFAAPHSAWL